jgi:predicted ATPase
MVHLWSGNYATAKTLIDELFAVADMQGSAFWKAWAVLNRGCLFALTAKLSDAITKLTDGLAMSNAIGAKLGLPFPMLSLATAHAHLGEPPDAEGWIDETIKFIETSKEEICKAEAHRMAGEIVLMSTDPSKERAEKYFDRALTVAREQQAKSWELRAAMSMARLWRSQGKPQQARELLAPVYNWFTEGFDTLDLKEAKALLEELAA